jgi:hypothetical protein
VGQVELFVWKGDGRLKAYPVCPDEGSCLQKVMTRCKFGHVRRFALCERTAGVIRRSAEPRMQRTSMFFLTGISSIEGVDRELCQGGGEIYVCSSCFKERGLAENNLVKGATTCQAGSSLSSWSSGAPCITY